MQLVIFILLIIPLLFGATHTVGSGKDYATPQACADAVSTAGDICLIDAGDYSATSPTIETKYAGIIFRAASGTVTMGRISVQHANTTLDGLTIVKGTDYSNANILIGIVATPVNGTTVQNCTLTPQSNSSQGGSPYGITVIGSNTTILNNTFSSDGIKGFFIAIALWGGKNVSGTTIQGNTFSDMDNVEQIIGIGDSDGTIIKNNTVYGMLNTDGGFHVDFIQNVDTSGDATDEATRAVVDGNYIYSSPAMQITLLGGGMSGRIVNNVFSETASAFVRNWTSSLLIANNTFYKVTENNNAILTYGSGAFTIKNNLFIGCGADLNNTGWYGQGDAGSPTITADYNYVTKTSAASYGAKSSFTGTETNNPTNGNPLFVTEGSDWRLQSGSPAKDTGADLSAVWASALDKNGVSRPQGAAWDVGAMEYYEQGNIRGASISGCTIK